MKHLNDYIELHDKGYFQGNTLLHYKDTVESLVKRHKATTLLDYGCGKGEAWKEISIGFKPTLYDPGYSKFSVLPSQLHFDGVLCVDVVEHCPEEEIEALFERLFSYATKFILITFCNRGSKKRLPSTGQDVHITQRPRSWWEAKIDRHNKHGVEVWLFETK